LIDMRPILLLALLCGCATNDLDRPGTWRPNGANDTNLRAMIADPAHLRAGVAAPTERAEPATQAIRRLQTDRRRPLPDSRAAQIGVTTPGMASAPPVAIGGPANAP
jgi:hypothetical protein